MSARACNAQSVVQCSSEVVLWLGQHAVAFVTALLLQRLTPKCVLLFVQLAAGGVQAQ